MKENVLCKIGFELLLEGEPVSIERLAEKLEHDPITVKEKLSNLEQTGRCTLNSSGSLTGIGGLSVVPAPHRLHMKDKVFLYMVCIRCIVHSTCNRGRCYYPV
jgi:hypothetical protein